MNRKKQNNSQSKRIKTVDRYDFKLSVMVVLLIVLFCCYSFILVSQRSAVNALDERIRQLNDEYNQAVKINDDLQGQLLKGSNLPLIEDYAINVLGMVKPSNDSVTYVSYGPQNGLLDAQEQTDGTSDSVLAAWLDTLFK